VEYRLSGKGNKGDEAPWANIIDEKLLQHLSPLGWEHINLTGDYVWNTSKKLGKAFFRPLRQFSES